MLNDIFLKKTEIKSNLVIMETSSVLKNQEQTNKAFSEKWSKKEQTQGLDAAYEFQKQWYLSLYGFKNENELAAFLSTKKIILDAGCGLGYKAAWFAELAPQSAVLGIDFSESVYEAAEHYKSIKNLLFLRGNITNTGIKPGSIDYISCDQVIMHTEDPGKTFDHLSSITAKGGEFACYVYAKKALPRELLDDYFRTGVHNFTMEQIWELSDQLTELGKRLSDLHVSFEAPDIPLLGIKGGTYDVQRFIYWNFIKCFYNEKFTKDINDMTNFDWYSPSNAKRFSEAEFRQMIERNSLETTYFHKEEACYSGRFKK